MAFSAHSGSTSSSAYAFQDDDEETWKLVASSESPADLGQRLTSLAGRLEEDHPSNPFWETILEKVQSHGFRYSSGGVQSLSKSNNSTKPPVAFESEAGQRHIAAVSALLGGISNDRAVQVTLNALRSIDSDGSQFQSLLGSRDLLWKTLLHHQQQRLARLGVLTECLRLEQDPEASAHGQVQSFLDSLDSLFKDEDRYRGLFRRLLTIACGPTITPSREQLEPAKELRTDQSRLNSGTSTPQQEWHAFGASLVEELQMQQMRERREACEALLVLLYERINDGVRRSDYAILLLAFQSSNEFFTKAPGPPGQVTRLTQLAGLICAECTALWRTLEDSSSHSVWAAQHPLLLEISGSGHPQVAKQEIEALRVILSDLVQEALLRNAGVAPESLGMLSFGLLLCLAHQSFQASAPGPHDVWSSFATTGTEMVQLANDQCGAFDYLYTVLDDLTRTASSKRSSAAHDRLYDWQFANKTHSLLLENGAISSKDTAPDSTAFTSIAREILAASISSFEGSVLAIDKSDSCDNIGMLCKIGAKVFQNNPLLCEQFWSDWEEYSGGNSSTSPFPICKLLDASHRLAIAALQAYGQGQVPKEFFVQAVAPFFQLLSTLCHTSELVETTVATLPEGLVRHALLSCRLSLSSPGLPTSDYQKSRFVLLTAIGRLALYGNSRSCLEQLRLSLEESSQRGVVDGPRVLSRLIVGENQLQDTVEPVLTIMAHLLDGAPQEWALHLAREIMESQDSQKVTLAKCFSPGGPTVHAASLVLAELIEHLTAVVFCDAVNAHDAIVFLHCVKSSLLAAAAALASSLSIPTMTSSATIFSFETAQTILQSLSNFLKVVRTVIELHGSGLVRDNGVQVRDSIIDALATSTGLGHAIIYYATAPVSLTLAIKLQGAMEDRSILQQVAIGASYDADEAQKYGAWQAYLAENQRNSSTDLGKQFLFESIAKLTSDDIDLDGIMARNWTGVPDAKAPFDTAFSAIRLLSQWASHVEDIISTQLDTRQIVLGQLDAHTKAFVESKSPHKMLSSLATLPMPCRRDGAISLVWSAAGISNFELLLPYLSGPTESNPELYESIPSSTLLDLLHACLGHVWSISQKEMVADSLLFRAVYRSSRFAQLLFDCIDRALEVNKKYGDPDEVERAQLLDGILSLRVLASCVGSNVTVADSVLHPQGKSIISKLVSAASEVKSLPLSSGGTLFDIEAEITGLRLATGCLAVLAVLWQIGRSLSPAQTDSKGSKLIGALDDHGSLITDLVTIVSSYALSSDLEARVGDSATADYARGSLITYMGLALQLLGTEAAHDANKQSPRNAALQNFLLKDFVRSSRFIGFEGYARVAAILEGFQTLGFSKAPQPIKILQCFPATSTTLLAPDFFSGGNSFDVSAAAYWLSQSSHVDEHTVNELVTKLSVSQQVLNAELFVMEAWKRFAEMGVLYHAHLADGVSSTERVFGFVQDTIQAFCMQLGTVNMVQVEKGDFLAAECRRMANTLADTLLYFLNMGAQYTDPRRLSFDELVTILGKVADGAVLVLAVSFPTGIDSEPASEQSCLALSKTILASAIVVLNTIDANGTTSDGDQSSRVYESFKSLCRVNSKTLQIACNLLQRNPPLALQQDLHESFVCCISLFTSLLTRNHGSRLDDNLYFKAVTEIMLEYNVAEYFLEQAIRCSVEAAKCISKDGSSRTPGAQEHLLLLQGVLDLLFSIAEAGSTDLVGMLPCPKLAQLLVRNPLFSLPHGDNNNGMPRGYVVSKPNNGGYVPGTFQVGEDDPLHIVWTTSMKILTACMHGSSSSGTGHEFLDISLEFLQVYHAEHIFALKACGSRLTRNGLNEASSLLGLVAAICKRNTRDYSLRAQRALCLELVEWAKVVVASLAKFLGAAGAARELFHCIEQLCSESENLEIGSSLNVELWHPLLDEGVPSAKHEAVKFSHYASKCYQRVTASDFRASSGTSQRLIGLEKSNENDTDLERASRVSITNEFAGIMERCAAACLGQAVSVLWRMHPSSFSFRMVGQAEIGNFAVMTLVKTGTIIGFHPFEGGGALLKKGDGFDALNFGRVVSIDTIKRTWTVSPLKHSGSKIGSEVDCPTWLVRAGQLAGFEDPSYRKASTAYLPAPNPMSELENTGNKLSLGHLILILRWCHQETLFQHGGSSVENGPTVDGAVRTLAEQATALLGAELAIHEEVGSGLHSPPEAKQKLDAQIFELFACRASDCPDDEAAVGMRDGRLKSVIDSSAWDTVRSQVGAEVQRYWRERQEKERRRSEKRVHGSDMWYPGLHRKGHSQKSAFRGIG